MKRILLLLSLVAVIGCKSEKFVVVQIADAQLGFYAAEEAKKNGTEYVDDLSFEVEYLKKAVALVNEIKPDAVVFTGDQVHRSGNENQWNTFAETISAIDESVKQFHLPGNHDVVIKKGALVDMTPFTKHYPEDRFIYEDKGVKLVGINSNRIKYVDSLETEQIEWIKKAVAKEKESDVTILFSHHPFFLENIAEEDGYFQIQKAKRQTYFDIFTRNDVDALVAGHLHNCAQGEEAGIPVRTTTSIAFQIGDSQPSIRVITVEDGKITEELIAL